MQEYPDHVLRNRTYWSGLSESFRAPGHRAWSEPNPSWGIWNVPDADIHALPADLAGLDTIELGCGTGYFSAWLAKAGARPVGIDITPAQLDKAREFQQEFGIVFPLIEGSAEAVPLPDASFDLAFSEYGASIWCDPYIWIPEAARLLRPGGTLVFLRNAPLSIVCTPNEGPASTLLVRPWFGLHRIEWPGEDGVEFSLPTGEMLRLLRRNGFEIEDLIELQAPADAPETRFEYMNYEWARQWPSEEIWRARKIR